MKITYLSSPISSQYGGGEKFLDDFTTGINAEHEFIGSSKAVFDLFQSKGYKSNLISGLFEPVSPKNVLLFPISIVVGFFQFVRFYKTFKASDWIISPTSHCETFFVIPWIKLFLRKPVLFMVHAKPPKVFKIFPFNWLVSKCWGNSPVTFVSYSQKELWVNAGCLSSNQIVIYNGVKISHFPKSCGGQIPLVRDGSEADGGFQVGRGKSLKLGFLARLHKEKGCDTLINALELVKSQLNIEIQIAGDGPEKDNLIKLYESKQLPKNIQLKFVGFQNDTKAFYETLDLLIFPSRRESFGLVICEAMERGVSVLCSNIPSSLEVKNAIDIEGETNLIFQVDNTQDLASKIDGYINNQNQYLNLEYKQKLHDTIVQKFSSETMIGEYKKVLVYSSTLLKEPK